MSKLRNWYVITGGPGSGKTTIINNLSKLGYFTIPEYSRFFIEREMKKGKKISDIRGNEVKFQDKLLKIKLMMDKKAPKNKTVFFDRGLPDSLAYYIFLKSKPPELLRRMNGNTYKKVFMLDMLPYKNDSARIEHAKDAKKIHLIIKKVYKDLGYEVIRIPVMTVEKRVKLILSKIR